VSTIAEVDERLDQARQAYWGALTAGKLALADTAYATMDALLDERPRRPRLPGRGAGSGACGVRHPRP